MALPSALAPLCAIPNWVLWRRERRDDDDEGRERWTKPPYMARAPRRYASTADSATWAPYELAEEVAEREGLRGINGGTGFVLKDCAFSGVDLDKCINEDGSFCAAVASVIRQARAAGCYIEISPSGMGLHIFGRSSSGPVHTKWGVGGGAVVEVFRNTRRFLTVTGKQIFEEDFCEGMGDIDTLIDVLIKGRPEGRARATVSASRANGAASTGNGSGGSGGGGGGSGADSTTSGLFHKKVCDLADRGLNTDEICATMRKNAKRYSDTKAGAYEAQGRLAQEVERCFAKWEKKHGARLEVEWATGRLPKGGSLGDALAAVTALGIRCSNDEFHVQHFVEGQVLGRWAGKLTDEGVAHIRGLILYKYGFDPKKETLNDALYQLAIEMSFNPVREYLDDLVWDGRERLDGWVMKYLGCEDTELNRMIGRLTLIAAVRRVRMPGTKFDQIVVLEGEEGTDKSKAIETLAGEENFSDQSILDVRSSREQQELLQGVWLYEVADLKGLHHSDINAVKAFASRRTDRARPAYGRRRVDQPRQCIMFGTTNDTNYLKGSSGNRRWWPLLTTRVRIELLRRDRDQLWAEAAAREAAGESIVLPEHLWGVAKVEQDLRLEQDPWDLRLAEVKGGKYRRRDGLEGWEERVRARDLYTVYLGLKASDEKGGGTGRRVSEAMRRLDWMPTQVRIGGVSAPGWVRLHDE